MSQSTIAVVILPTTIPGDPMVAHNYNIVTGPLTANNQGFSDAYYLTSNGYL